MSDRRRCATGPRAVRRRSARRDPAPAAARAVVRPLATLAIPIPRSSRQSDRVTGGSRALARGPSRWSVNFAAHHPYQPNSRTSMSNGTQLSTQPAASAPALAHVVLGVTGGIAAYKAAELTRLLVKAGIVVDVVMTDAATHFVTAVTFQALSGRPVLTDLWESGAANAMGHIAVSRGADAILVAPASADFLAKLAQGRADDLLSTLCLARECPLLVAPAMNRQMWANKATQRNVAQLAAGRRGDPGPRHRRTRVQRKRRRPDARARGAVRGAGRVAPAESAGGQARAADGRADVRGDRPGARHHEFEFRQDGLRAGAGGGGSGRAGDGRRRAVRRWQHPRASRAST